MKKFSYIFLFIVLVFFYGCNSSTKKEYRNDKNQLVIEEWFNDNQLKSRIVYLNEEKTDYSSVEYLDNGHIKDSSTYKNNLIQGTHKVYDISNDLLHTETYRDGLLHGPHKAVYSSGVASFIGYQLNGNKVGEWKFSYPDGNPITYEFYDSTGRLKYFLKYEKDGQHLQSEGSGIIHVSDIKKTDDNFSIDVLAAIPTNCNSILKILIPSEEQEFEIFNQELETIRNTIPINSENLNNNELQIELSIIDNKTNKVESFVINKNVSIPSL